MRETQNAVAKTHSHIANIRLNGYQAAVNLILSRYDTVYIGSYRDGSPQSSLIHGEKLLRNTPSPVLENRPANTYYRRETNGYSIPLFTERKERLLWIRCRNRCERS